MEIVQLLMGRLLRYLRNMWNSIESYKAEWGICMQ
jgi:hypothetical protein